MIETIKHFHMFCGSGGGARGFNRGEARVGSIQAKFECLGGVDSDPSAIRDFCKLSGSAGTVLDLFDRQQFKDFHGHEPPQEWREAGFDDIRRAAKNERPNIVFLSPPCKGFSGLLSEKKSQDRKYLALNRLTLRGIWLMLEAWSDQPPELVILENVPRIQTRGRALLDEIKQLLSAYGYAVAESKHDCGQLGGLAQSRKRFLLVARHIEQVPPYLFEPRQRPLKSIGAVLGDLPLPGLGGNPMHVTPKLEWRTWVRLAFVEAGGDWRSLDRLRTSEGVLRDYLIMPEGTRGHHLGVCGWDESIGALSGRSTPTNGRYSIADPRLYNPEYGRYSIVSWREGKKNYQTGGHYGVLNWDQQSGAVIARAKLDRGSWSVADPRLSSVPLPDPDERGVFIIRSPDGAWHRPLSTLELAVLQGLIDPDEDMVFDGFSHANWRERIGNAVPPPAASAIASAMGQTLLLARSGETFVMSSMPVWVRPTLAGLMAAPQHLQ